MPTTGWRAMEWRKDILEIKYKTKHVQKTINECFLMILCSICKPESSIIVIREASLAASWEKMQRLF